MCKAKEQNEQKQQFAMNSLAARTVYKRIISFYLLPTCWQHG